MEKTFAILTKLLNTPASFNRHLHYFGAISEEFIKLLEESIIKQKLKVKHISLNVTIYKDLMNLIESDQSSIFIISNAEHFCNFNKEGLKVFLFWFKKNNMKKLITLSKIPWSKIEASTLGCSFSFPLQFHIPTLPIDSIKEKISMELQIPLNIVSFIFDSIEPHYRDYDVLRHIVKNILKEMQSNNSVIEINEKIVLDSKFRDLCKEIKNDKYFKAPDSLNFLDYPQLTKCAIVAVYYSSYNPQSADRRFIFKKTDITRRKHNGQLQIYEKLHEIGPRFFEHQRARFIFSYFVVHFLNEKDEVFDPDFNSQILILLQDGIISRYSNSQALSLEQPKYRCLCSLNYAEQIANSLNKDLKLRDFLLDFAME